MKNTPFPKLGRPFTGGSPRDKYLKFYLTEDELKNFERLEKDLIKIYQDRGYHYNRPSHFRFLLFNLVNPGVLNSLFENLTSELKDFHKMD